MAKLWEIYSGLTSNLTEEQIETEKIKSILWLQSQAELSGHRLKSIEGVVKQTPLGMVIGAKGELDKNAKILVR